MRLYNAMPRRVGVLAEPDMTLDGTNTFLLTRNEAALYVDEVINCLFKNITVCSIQTSVFESKLYATKMALKFIWRNEEMSK